ncbi:Uncharacterized protein PCOAH_00049140 [Plasmodium coatneyi]|uniref:Uncharacterized protein n=1 Tax=Plasmodium coatneyi TaxID=208452 RepID=A0A1B1E687_9APIC|nr:Uncharacterized protein PCOAH_00049140 [Plasmodium coatneyi]ANQ10536.1 Uncharacterized protein PCOAH_00049140 [Plasmodium coatneyi]
MTEGSSPNGDVETIGKCPPTDNSNSKKCKYTYKRRELEGGPEAEWGDEHDRSLKKLNYSRDFSEETKPPDLLINYYYEWEDIPTVNKLPYGLIGKEKNALWEGGVRSEGTGLGGNLSKDRAEGEEVNVKCEDLGITVELGLDGGASDDKPTEGEACRGDNFLATLIYEDIVEYIQKIKKKGSRLKCASGHIEPNTTNKSNETHMEKTRHSVDRQDGEGTWVDDFVTLTNIQILAKNTKIFSVWEKLEVVLPYITTQCGSPRSCLCKKSFLTMKHLCMSIKEDKLNVCRYFVKSFPHVIRKMDTKNHFLDECASQVVENFMKHSNAVNDYEMLRVMCSFSDNKNSSIIKKLAFFVFLFLKNLPTSELVSLPVKDFAQSFLHFMNAKLEETKRYMKQTFTLLLTVHSEDDLVSSLLDGAPKKGNLSSLEREIRTFLRNRSCGDAFQPLKKKYATFHQFRNSKSLSKAHKTSSFVL